MVCLKDNTMNMATLKVALSKNILVGGKALIVALLSSFLITDNTYCQHIVGDIDTYAITTADKELERVYYFKVMDSLVAARPQDTIYGCRYCISFMYQETKIPSSGHITYFGQMEFTKDDLVKWHEWYERNHKKRRKMKMGKVKR